MSHPYQQHREHHVERERVHRIAGHHEPTRTHHVTHRAKGGRVHEDEAEDKAIVKSMVKGSALKHDGHKPKHRADKPHRAKGGRVKGKHKATIVNVNVAPQQPQAAPHPMPIPVPGPAAGAAPPQMPPRPPMMPPPGGPPGMPPGMPPMMGPHASGGRVGYKRGGRVKRAEGGDVGPLARRAGRAALREEMGGEPAFFGPVNRKLYGVPLKGKSADEVQATKQRQMRESEDISDAVPRKTGGPVEPHLKQGVGMGPSGKGAATGPDLVAKSMKGNRIYAPSTDAMAPHHKGGTGGAAARMEMSHRAAKTCRKTPPGVHTP